jgi:hypothetical protein
MLTGLRLGAIATESMQAFEMDRLVAERLSNIGRDTWVCESYFFFI